MAMFEVRTDNRKFQQYVLKRITKGIEFITYILVYIELLKNM
jgi:hypothetical protein